MKPINATVQPGGNAQAGGSAQPAQTPPPSDLNAIDVSSLDRLIAVRQEQSRIDGYRTRAEEKKSEVADAVFKRVMDDYGRRSTALDQQSAPLRAQARTEYRKLKAMLDELGSRHEQARLQKDEIEFRHAVGELNDAELTEQLADPQGVLDQCEIERKALDETKARFIDALGSLEALESSDPPARETAPAREATPVRDKPAVEPRPTGSVRVPSSPETGHNRNRPQTAPDPTSGLTMVLPSTARRMAAPAADYSTRPMPPEDPPEDADEGATMMLAAAAVVIIEPASLSQDFQLGALNGIGRSDENQICLSNSGISRKHAVIKAVPGGFAIKDLASQNGTFVNGQRVTEQMLTDGDTIEVGSVKFVFRMPWSATPSTSPGRPSARQGNR